MRKTWLTALLSFSFLVLVACQSEDTVENTEEQQSEETEHAEENDDSVKKETYQRKEEDDLEVTVDIEHQGNEVIRQITTTTAKYDMIEADDKEEAKQKFEDIGASEQFEDEAGIDYDLEFEDDYFVETMDVNYQDLDPERLEELTSDDEESSEESNDEVVKKVSYDLTIEDLEESGFKKIEK